MISRIEFPDGIRISDDLNDARNELARIVMESNVRPVVLTPGTYDITPKIWSNHTHIHEVTALDNGEGLYRMYPRTPEATITAYVATARTLRHKGGHVSPINDENPHAAVLGRHPLKRGLHVFGVLAFFEITL